MSKKPIESIAWVRRNLTRFRSLKIEEVDGEAIITSKSDKTNPFEVVVSFIPTKERGELWRVTLRNKKDQVYYGKDKTGQHRSRIDMTLRREDRISVTAAIARAILTKGD